MASKRILILDDEENIGRSLRMILEREGYVVSICRTGQEFRASAERERAGAFLLDVRLPDASGIDLLRELRQADIQAPVIMISGHGTIADAVEATRAGAFDFLEKPLSRDRVLLSLERAFEQANLKEENARLKELAPQPHRMIGSSSAFKHIVEQATLAARSDARVLFIGESGTGKELLAAHIHEASPFSAGPFVKVNCAAIPQELIESELFGHEKGAFTGAAAVRRGKFELADGGTLFLDEVGDLAAASQAKLLRVLEEGEFHRLGGERTVRVSVRVVAATNRDLNQMASEGKFRGDLYWRLAGVPLRVPSLRERVEDVQQLAEYFLDEFCRRNNFRKRFFAKEAVELLRGYHWPGNVRELRNTVERMAILAPGDQLGEADVPLEIRFRASEAGPNVLEEARRSAERDQIMRALTDTRWNVSRAARSLGLERTNLHKRIRALGLRRA